MWDSPDCFSYVHGLLSTIHAIYHRNVHMWDYEYRLIWQVYDESKVLNYYLGVKVFNAIPSDVKTEFNNPKKFKVFVQKRLYEKSFYSLDEYFDLQKCSIHIWIQVYQPVL